MQVDESTVIAGLSVFLVFVRYLYGSEVEEEMLMCKPLPAHTAGECIFNVIGLYMAEKGLSRKLLILSQVARE
jgi:hypothetical protein